MGNKPARVRQREVETLARIARKQGAKSIEVRIGKEALVFPCVKMSRNLLRPTRKSVFD
jgi:hypothetical protein